METIENSGDPGEARGGALRYYVMHAASPRGNLSASAQDTQLRAGLISLATALAVAAALGHSGAPAGYRALVFIPFFVAVYGVLAALYGTCGISAIAGMRITCQGRE